MRVRLRVWVPLSVQLGRMRWCIVWLPNCCTDTPTHTDGNIMCTAQGNAEPSSVLCSFPMLDWSDDALQSQVAFCQGLGVEPPRITRKATKLEEALQGSPVATPKRKQERAEHAPHDSPQSTLKQCNTATHSSTGAGVHRPTFTWDEHRRHHFRANMAAARVCPKCRWAANRKRGGQLTPLNSSVGSAWLQAKPLTTPDCDWGVGCQACVVRTCCN